MTIWAINRDVGIIFPYGNRYQYPDEILGAKVPSKNPVGMYSENRVGNHYVTCCHHKQEGGGRKGLDNSALFELLEEGSFLLKQLDAAWQVELHNFPL